MNTTQIGRIILPNTGGSIIGRQAPTHGAPDKVLKRPVPVEHIQKAFDEKMAAGVLESMRARGAKNVDKLEAELAKRVGARAQPSTTPPAPAPAPATSSSATEKTSKAKK